MTCDTDCVIVYDRTTDGDFEVYEGLVRMGSTPSFADGWPLLISRADPALADPSLSPSVALVSDGRWAISFTDVAVVADGDDIESESDIRGFVGDGVQDLVTDSIGQHQQSKIGFDGVSLGLLYVNDVQGEVSLQMAMFDDEFERDAAQRTVFEESADGAFEVGSLLWTDGYYAAVWISTPNSGNAALRFSAFNLCSPVSK
jgi:hypothetical protein